MGFDQRDWQVSYYKFSSGGNRLSMGRGGGGGEKAAAGDHVTLTSRHGTGEAGTRLARCCRAGPSLVLVQICWTTTFRSVDELDLVGKREVLQCLLTLSPAPGCVEVFLTEAGRLLRTGPFQQRGSRVQFERVPLRCGKLVRLHEDYII